MVVEGRTLSVSWAFSSPFISTVTRFERSVRAVETLATLSALVILTLGGTERW